MARTFISHKARNTYLEWYAIDIFQHASVQPFWCFRRQFGVDPGGNGRALPQIWNGVRRLILMFPEFLFVVCIVCIWYCGINA